LIFRCVDDAMSDENILTSLSDSLQFNRSTLVRAFKKFDRDRNGALTEEEFATALRASGMKVSEERARAMVKRFDVNGDGTLACWEFIRMMAGGGEEEDGDGEEEGAGGDRGDSLPSPPGSPLPLGSPAARSPARDRLVVRGDETQEVQEKIATALDLDECEVLADFKQTLTEENRKLKETFKGIAEGGKTVDKDQLLKGLEKLGCTVDEPSAARLVEKFDVDGTGELHFYEFLRMMNNAGL